jgi:hypothetical protein
MTLMAFLRRALSLLPVAALAQGQLYLVTGTVTGSPESEYFGSSLLRVERDGKTSVVSELVPDSAGLTYVGVSYDWRRLVIRGGGGEKGGPETVLVLDFDKADAVKRCQEPDSSGKITLYSWLAKQPNFGPALEWLSVDDTKSVEGMLIEPTIPCDKSFVGLTPGDVRFFVAHGLAGIADVADLDGPRGWVDGVDGQVRLTSEAVAADYKIPLSLRSGPQSVNALILINDSHSFVISLTQEKAYRILVFRKGDQTWHTLPIPSERHPNVRGFGKYIAGLEVQDRNPGNPRSPGEEKWPTKPRRTGPDLTGRVREVYPGKLHVYDVDTERVFSITTNQGDSEILLIENSTVYYRVNDQIYAAPITERGLGRGRLLATDEAIRDAHWAFLKR